MIFKNLQKVKWYSKFYKKYITGRIISGPDIMNWYKVEDNTRGYQWDVKGEVLKKIIKINKQK
jgi:hypothetical protein